MKTMTTNLKYFSSLTAIFSVIFFYYLYTAISIDSYDKIWIYATLYGAVLFISGLILGYHDTVRDSRLDLGFHYHLMTFIIVNLIGILSAFVVMGFNIDTLLYAILPIAFWTLGLFVHHYLSSKTIKGMDKGNIFD